MIIISLEKNKNLVAWAQIENGELIFLSVEPDFRNQGYGEAVLIEVLSWMKKTRVRTLPFCNINNGFWIRMAEKFPLNVRLPEWGEGMLLAPCVTRFVTGTSFFEESRGRKSLAEVCVRHR